MYKRQGFANIFLEGITVEKVNSFKYFGSMVTWNGSCLEEIRSRISMDKRASEKVKASLTGRRILTEMKNRSAKCFVWSVVSYGSETWTPKRKKKVT